MVISLLLILKITESEKLYLNNKLQTLSKFYFMKCSIKTVSLFALIVSSLFLFQSCTDNDEPKKEDLVTITGISPESGTAETTVVITGSGFSSTLANNLVTLNGKECSVANATISQLTIKIPTDAGSGKIKVTVNGNVAESSFFTYTTSGSGGTSCPLDNTFGTNGKVYLSQEYHVEYTALAVQSDNKIIGVGYKSPQAFESNTTFVTRRLSNGTLDTDFNSTGVLKTGFGSVYEFCYTALLDANENIVIAGSANGSYAIARFLPNGQFDNSFSEDGKQILSFGEGIGSSIKKILLQSDGKIVAIGEAYGGSSFEFSAARFNTNGTLDASFGTDGKAVIPIDNLNDFGHDAVLQADGKIVIAGRTTNTTTGEFAAALVRLNSNGTLDTSFGNNGKVNTLKNSYVFAEAVALDANGKIVVTGHSDGSMIVLRYNSNGSLDTTFGNSGYTITNFDGQGSAKACAIALDNSGKIIIGGYGYEPGLGGLFHSAIARFNTNGTLDTTFDKDGKLVTIMGSYNSGINDLVLQKDGKLLLAGYSMREQGGLLEFAMFRLENCN
jgi:uncharacterized delta-60 repeat protein